MGKTLEERVSFLEKAAFGGTPCSDEEFAALVPCAAGERCIWIPGTAASNHVMCPKAPAMPDEETP